MTSSGSCPARTRSSGSVRRFTAAWHDSHGGEVRLAPVDTDAKLSLFHVPERGMRLVVVDSPVGEGESRRQLASALAELWRRHSTEPRQRQWCGWCCFVGVGAWHRLPERKVTGWQRSGSGCSGRKQASREKETQWRSDEAGWDSATNGDERCRGRGRLGRRGVPCLGVRARHVAGCSSRAGRGTGALPCRGKRAEVGGQWKEKKEMEGEAARWDWLQREGTN
jgi:hypothetical protein